MILLSLKKMINEKTIIQIISSVKSVHEIQRQPTAPWHDWSDSEIRRNVAIKIIQNGLNTKVDFDLLNKNQIQHSRELQIEWIDGKTCSIRLDEGFGCWGIYTSSSFPFESSLEDQVKFLLEMDGTIFMRHPDLGTYIDCFFR